MGKKLFLEEKAQASTEYLLILAGILIIVATVGIYLKTLASQQGQRAGAMIPEVK